MNKNKKRISVFSQSFFIPDSGMQGKIGFINGPNNERYLFRIDLDRILEVRNNILSDLWTQYYL